MLEIEESKASAAGAFLALSECVLGGAHRERSGVERKINRLFLSHDTLEKPF